MMVAARLSGSGVPSAVATGSAVSPLPEVSMRARGMPELASS